ncbi:molecular chaperone DnaJ, partial [Candidatus Kaiserbacteria bacterium]|nr:molecular chaperone DnaJ [Candidatus Kaiserbacteria bacterium]
CQYCNGNGAKSGTELKTCPTCNGTGKIHETRRSIMGSFSTVRECSACNGTGKIPKEKCPYCAGMGISRTQEEIAIKVPSGIQNGEVIRLTGRGEAMPHGQPGDLYIKVSVEPHRTIFRDGANLLTKLPIKVTDALLGGSYKVVTLDGEVEIKIPAGITHGEFLRLKNKGVPIDNHRG